MKIRSLAALLVSLPLLTFAAPRAKSEADHADYVQVTNARAAKIVAKLGVTDPARAEHVRDVIAQFYRDLNAAQNERDARIKAAKADAALTKEARDAAIKQARADADAQREKLRTAFVAELNAQLTPAQVDAVKDGLTYGVAPLTCRVYLEMLPNLTPAQQQQIHDWLLEAREHAIAGFTSEEKHGWFGKYKGRINNYLAKQGYNVKQAEHDFIAAQKSKARH